MGVLRLDTEHLGLKNRYFFQIDLQYQIDDRATLTRREKDILSKFSISSVRRYFSSNW